MQLKDIVSISGQSGLHKIISQTKAGVIVENLEDKKRIPVSSTAKISSLEDISIFTLSSDVPLKEVFIKYFKLQNGAIGIDPKSDQKILKKKFLEILPDYDQNRVYTSDMKKFFLWYNILQKNNLIEIEEEQKDTGGDQKPEEGNK